MSRRTRAIVLSLLFPGLGHFVLGRFLFGVLLALFYGICLEWLLISGFIIGFDLPRVYTYTCMALAVAIWGGALSSVIVVVRADTEGRRARKDQLLTQGMNFLLQNELEAAEQALLELIKLDGADVEAYLYLGSVYEAKGNPALAHGCFKTSLNLDEPGKWRELLRERLSQLKGAASARARQSGTTGDS